MKYEDVALERIAFDDSRFRISFFFGLSELKRSIAEIGLINPPAVVLRSNRIVVVAGWKRAEACRRLSFPSIPCRILEEPSDLQAFHISLHDNIMTRELSICERAEILKKLQDFGVGEETLVTGYLPLLGIPATRIHLEAHLAAASFDSESKEFIHEENTPYPVLACLIGLSRSERKSVLPFLRHLGRNKQKELVEHLMEISRRDSVSIMSVLSAPEIETVIRSHFFSEQQKAERVRAILRRKRYPALTATTDSFLAAVKSIAWPENIAVEPPPFFESEDVSVKFSFRSSEEFGKKVEELKAVADEGRISSLLKSFSDD